MSTYENIKNAIITRTEALYTSSNSDYVALRAALGDVGTAPNFNVVTISDVDFLVGSTFNPKAIGTEPEDGPDPVQADNTVISVILKGLGDAIDQIREPSGVASILQYEVVSYDSSSRMQLGEADGGSRQKNPIGVAVEAATSINQMIGVHTRVGHKVNVRFDSIPLATENGKAFFLDTTPGRASLIKPSALGEHVLRLGILLGANGTTITPECLWSPLVFVDSI